ncbi:MAG TPA: cytochrome c [Candidatus Limnocylindrales bacterium]|nr:cytochrome c [Candidatus Limnocylindrales bacterium]
MKACKHGIVVIFFLLSGALLSGVAAGDGLWMTRVPEKDRAKRNPFASNANAPAAGAKLYSQNCASCHGEDATGKDHHPSLRTERVRGATPGELQWLLTNGSMKNGMPSWSKLPEPQRWQIVSYIKSLQATPEAGASARSSRER